MVSGKVEAGTLGRKLRMGMVGGGREAFIGAVHRRAAMLDGGVELVAGAFSSTPEKSRLSGRDLYLNEDRIYGTWQEMIEQEAKRPPEERLDFISIVTPNYTHYAIAMACLEAGFHVVCDKPMTLTFAQAQELVGLVEKSGVVFAVTHNYTGNPLVRQARQMVQNGELGEIQAFRSNYIQGWLRSRLETTDQKQAKWRTDPAKSGAAGCFGDIGTHAYNLARYITGLIPAELSAQLKIFEQGRQLDDYGHAVIRFTNGAIGTVTASQISHGRENDLFIEIDGTKGSLQWRQENPNEMIFRRNGQPHAIYTRDPNAPHINDAGKAACRIPSGHPEGYLEAFANVYRSAYDAMAQRGTGQQFETRDTIYPNVYDGAEGMLFIEQSVASSKENGAWVRFSTPYARP